MKPSLATVLAAAAISAIAFACGAPETTGKANNEVNGKKTTDGDKEKKTEPKTDTSATTPKSDGGTTDGDPGMKCMLDCVGNDPQLRETLTCTDKCIPASKRKVDDSKGSSSDKEEAIELTPQEEACFTDCFDKQDKLCESAPTSCTKLEQCDQKCFPGTESGSSDDADNGGAGAGGGPSR